VQQYILFFNKTRRLALRARMTMTDSAAGQQVPFFLQPYLGGSDDLRGFRPYRFTDRNAVVYNAEYRWEIFSGLERRPVLRRRQGDSKVFHALGYHVPENHVVYFRPDLLELGPDVAVEDKQGHKHRMTSRDLSEILMRVYQQPDGRYRATASLAVQGKPVGPYRYFGTRSDDPNDTVLHEHRRDLRAMHLACAFIDHDDSRSINTLDVVADGASGKYVKHYQLDFGSTLGSASDKVNSPRSGGEYLFGWKQAGVQLVALGLAVPSWARARYPDLEAVSRFRERAI
jgi:hypothetical protein